MLFAESRAPRAARPTHTPYVDWPPMSEPDEPGARGDAARFRANLVRVMAVQVITLILLWLLQSGFSG